MRVAKSPAPVQPRGGDDEIIDRGTGAVGARAGRGVLLTLSSQWLKLLLQVAATVAIARMLSPNDYGVVGMVTALTGFADQIRELGLSDASVQRERLTRAQLDALFWVNAALGVGFGLLFCALAPLVARFYHRPELTVLTVVLSANFVAGGLSVQHSALLRRRLRFGRLALSDVGPMALSIAAGLGAAAAGAGYWALVVMYGVQSWGRLAVLWIGADWWPHRPRTASGLRELLSFGAHLSGFNVLNYVTRNLDNVLIGRYRGSTELGLYTRAYSLLMLPLQQLNGPIMRVAVPTLSSLRNDPNRFRSYYRSALIGLSIAGMPAVVLLGVLAPETIDGLLGRQYAGAAPIFQLLAIAGVVQVVVNTTGWLFIAAGRTRQMMRWGFVAGPVIVTAFLLGLPDGALGVARYYAIATLALAVPTFWFATRGTAVSMSDVATAIWRPVVVSGAVFGATAGLHRALVHASPGLRVGAVVLVALIVWAAAVGGWPSLRREVRALIAVVGRGLGGRGGSLQVPAEAEIASLSQLTAMEHL